MHTSNMKKLYIAFITVPVIVIAVGVCVTWIELNLKEKLPAGIDSGNNDSSTVSVRISRDVVFNNIPYKNEETRLNF